MYFCAGDNLLTAISVARGRQFLKFLISFTNLYNRHLNIDCNMIGTNDRVVKVNFEENGSSSRSDDGKPQLTYTLAEKTSLQALF